MPIDTNAARRFVFDAARLLDRHRFTALLDSGPREPVLAALRAYRNPDGGFGHALEPDLRAPTSQVGATLYALEILAELDAFDDPMAGDAVRWIASIADDDGAIPFAVGDIDRWPHAPWWQPGPGSFLTAAVAAVLHQGGARDPWLDRATEWTWRELEERDFDSAYRWRYLVSFLDHVDDRERAGATLDRIRDPLLESQAVGLDPDAESEQLTPLDYSPWPDLRSRRLFDAALVDRHLDALERDQQHDGGWSFDWPDWSPGATLDWRGSLTVRALRVLQANGRLG